MPGMRERDHVKYGSENNHEWRPLKIVTQRPMGTSKNINLRVTRPDQNAHLPRVNSAFGAVASLDSGVFRDFPMRFRC
jgi:hypothetical protein